jgi:hypothetical protein
MWEIFVLCNAIRFYDENILAKIAAGVALSEADCISVKRHLEEDSREIHQAIEKWSSDSKHFAS